MDVLVTDPELKRRLLRKRRAWGGDRYDEVWNGVYIMAPTFDDQHQYVLGKLGYILFKVLEPLPGVDIRLGINVSDRDERWGRNYRVPDVVVRYQGGISKIRDTHWLGGPDFLIEVASRGDRSRKKRPFYAKIGVREMMVVDRRPWAIELYRLADGELKLVGKSTLDEPVAVASEVVPLGFRLIEEGGKPRIEVVHRADDRRWLV